jgi:hypothetical protein
MATNVDLSESLAMVLSSIESVRAELAGLRMDLTGGPAVSTSGPPVNALVAAAKARTNPWTLLTEEQRASRVAQMKSGRAAKKATAAGDSARAPSDWQSFTDRIRSLLMAAGYSGPDLGPKVIQFAASLKDEDADFSAWSDEEILARRATWSPGSATKIAAPVAAVAGTSLDGFKSVMLSGNRYLVNEATGHAYHRLSDGGQGDWAGIFSKTPKPHINNSVPKPSGLEGGQRKSTRKHKRKQKKTRKH